MCVYVVYVKRKKRVTKRTTKRRREKRREKGGGSRSKMKTDSERVARIEEPGAKVPPILGNVFHQLVRCPQQFSNI